VISLKTTSFRHGVDEAMKLLGGKGRIFVECTVMGAKGIPRWGLCFAHHVLVQVLKTRGHITNSTRRIPGVTICFHFLFVMIRDLDSRRSLCKIGAGHLNGGVVGDYVMLYQMIARAASCQTCIYRP